mmetsp:Transcript_33358/g.33980  ORF Transcript_33358/g.33980 Transcript_33358/m.33980 type:complete len:487 (+) Transcript_33358:102-1562(+)|eukprot:CAMPEP_0182428824 /NCGR_PEP_ID=MMETSP1167-20130531/23852_1 /TAXON_ID=2988 /ORGANISM="Mallomonas Sp, Strain CCMP3275" /LENGTH=486 /DNA_ID=CAMNT_0024611945 /DNA_START=80 /DNA_END=1540 /DNA_ORIENTATION=+
MSSLSKVCRITSNTINANVKATRYAVRGPIVARAAELEQELSKPTASLPFKNIIACNTGNPHSQQQKPLTYIRDVLSLVINPALQSRANFPEDVVERANKYLRGIPGVGAYSESKGIMAVRKDISKFLEKRDGYPSNPETLFLTNGASEGVRFCMNTLLRDSKSGFRDGMLTPIPQYPIYSALTTLLDGNLVPYYLDESKGWGLDMTNVKDSITKARAEGITIRGLVIINPGNPTGNVLSESDLQELVTLCREEGICLMADEVYQSNIWKPNTSFISCRKVAYDMKAFDGPDPLQLISFHSVSKGFLGECGLRGGYFETLGIPPDVMAELYKMASISLCSNVIGQIAVGVMVAPPEEGEASHGTYVAERDNILASLKRRAVNVSKALNTMPGISCTTIDGALYAFPSITIPEKAIAEAKNKGVAPDALYCMELLEQTGIVLVPGSGFGQVEGTYHFRATILPPEEKMDDFVNLVRDFQAKFLERYA